jgi:hypothetical protein
MTAESQTSIIEWSSYFETDIGEENEENYLYCEAEKSNKHEKLSIESWNL